MVTALRMVALRWSRWSEGTLTAERTHSPPAVGHTVRCREAVGGRQGRRPGLMRTLAL